MTLFRFRRLSHVIAVLWLAFAWFAVTPTSFSQQAMTPESWGININSTMGGTPDNSTVVGTSPRATDGYDPDFDFPNPPGIGSSYIDGYFRRTPDDDGWEAPGLFATDVRGSMVIGERKEWTGLFFATNAGTTDVPAVVVLSWPGIERVPAEIVLLLLDPNDANQDGVTEYDLRQFDSVRFVTAANGGTIRYELAIRASRVELPGVLKGDVLENGRIDVRDVTTALRGAIGLIALTDRQRVAADVNRDGGVDLRDVTIILRMAVGLPIESE